MGSLTCLALVAALGTATWIAEPPSLLEPVASFGAATSGEWLYVYGGHRGETHAHSRENLSPLFSRVNLLDGRRWEVLPPGEPLQGLGFVAHGGRVIRVGGLSARNATGADEDLHSVATVAAYDPLARKWTELPSLPEPRSSHDAVVIGDVLYVVGGWTLAGESTTGTWHASAWSLDLAAPGSASWTRLPDPPFQRRALALATAGGKLHALGGMGPDGKPSRATFVYDPAARAWAAGPDLPIGGFGIAAIGHGDGVVVSGAEGEVVRLSSGRWEKLGTQLIPRIFHRLAALDANHLLALGGAAKGGHLTNVEVALAPGPGPRVSAWTIPFPGAAKNRQAVFLHDESLWVFGGNRSLEQHDFRPENFLTEGYRIHLGSFGITRVTDFPVGRETMATVVVDGQGFALGGFSAAEKGTRSWPDAFRFDFKKKAWDELPGAMPEPRTQFALAQHGGKVYVFGGMDYDSTRAKGDQFRLPLEVLAWSPTSRNAAFEPTGHKLTTARRAFGGAVLGDRFYLVGGMKAGFQLVEEAQAFDFASGAWETIPAPRPRISPRLVALGGKLYLAGGSTRGADGELGLDASLEVYDPATKKWSTVVAELPISPRHVRMIAWRDRLLLYSAHCEETAAVRVVVVDPGHAEDLR